MLKHHPTNTARATEAQTLCIFKKLVCCCWWLFPSPPVHPQSYASKCCAILEDFLTNTHKKTIIFHQHILRVGEKRSKLATLSFLRSARFFLPKHIEICVLQMMANESAVQMAPTQDAFRFRRKVIIKVLMGFCQLH